MRNINSDFLGFALVASVMLALIVNIGVNRADPEYQERKKKEGEALKKRIELYQK